MNDNGDRIRDFVQNLEKGELVTYGYIAERINDGYPIPEPLTSPKGVGAAIRSVVDANDDPDPENYPNFPF